MTNGKLSTFQMVMLISISRLFAFYIYLPIVSTPPANQDVWIVCLVSGILDIFVCFPMIYLASKFQNMSLLDYYKLIIGKVPSFIWGIILALFFLFNVIIAFNLISLFLGTVIMTETPYLVILLIVSIMCYYSVRKGFIVLGRVSQVIVPFVILSVVLFTLLNINNSTFAGQ